MKTTLSTLVLTLAIFLIDSQAIAATINPEPETPFTCRVIHATSGHSMPEVQVNDTLVFDAAAEITDLNFRHPDGTYVNWPCHPFLAKIPVLPTSAQIALKGELESGSGIVMTNTLEIDKNPMDRGGENFQGFAQMRTEYGDNFPPFVTNVYLVCRR